MPRPRCARLTVLGIVAVQLALLPACAGAQAREGGNAARPARTAVDTAALRQTLDSLAGAHRGVVGYAIVDVDGGARLSRRGDETFPTASLIKVPVLVTVFDLVARGMLSLDDRLTVLKIDKVPGSGQLQHLHDGAVITVRDAAWLMTTISDNTATNLLLDRIIIRRVWEKMEALGLENTKVHSKTFLRSSSVAMDSSVKYGLGVTTPNEMATLFALLARGRAVNPAADSAMLDILEHNEDNQMLQRFAGGVRAAHKTGATDAVRTECSLFHLSSRVVACVLTKENVDRRWVIDTEPQVTMARMGEAIVKAWGPPPPQKTTP
ncbi:MAG TPA: serine hydrolase [Gemmatimonadaceae bacterium]|jgi:beta-lactamase class A|nr:serine hydrolase [Gemmatimonadaceae bacterium]